MKELDIKRLWKGFWQLADPKIWIASTIPMAVGGALAYGDTGSFSIYWFAAALAGIYFIEIGKNAVNEFIDYRSGVDTFVTAETRTPFSGGKKTIVDGLLTVFETQVIAVLTIGAGSLIGLYIVLFREFSVLWIGLAGVFFSVFYSLPPFSFAYRGLGEVVVGITFGPLVLSGMYLVMAGTLTVNAVAASLPLGFLIANVLFINQYPDYEADKKGGKANWVVRLGKKRATVVYGAIFWAAYISLGISVLLYGNPAWLLGVLTCPIAFQSVNVAKMYYDDIPRLMKANANTVKIYQLIGLSMVIAAVTNRFISLW